VTTKSDFPEDEWSRIVRAPFVAGLAISLVALVHPFDVIVAGVVACFAFVLWPCVQGDKIECSTLKLGDSFHLFIWFLAGCAPALIYLLFLYSSNSIGREWSRIISALSPSPIQYLMGFGIVALLAGLGLPLLWNKQQFAGRVLVAWVAFQSLLLYAPVSFQRRLVEGLQLPLSIGASVGIFWLINRIPSRGQRKRLRRPVLAAVIALASITNVGFTVAETSQLTPADPRRYVSSDLIGAFKWLSANAEPDSILFSAYKTGNIAPMFSGLRVYIGHYDLTIHCRDKQDQVEAFYSGRMSGSEASSLLATNRASYVIYGPFEREISPEFAQPDCLMPVYNAGDVQLFKVVQ